jgi:spermidine/putrescine-binding protein
MSVAAGMGLSGFSASRSPAAEGRLNWITYAVYSIPDVLKGFEEQTNVQVNPVIMDLPTVMLTRIKGATPGQYDVTHGDALWPNAYHSAGLIDPIDLNSLSSAQGLFPSVKPFAPWKVGDNQSIAYPGFWGTSGVLFATGKVAPPNSWEALFDSKYKGRIVWRDKFDQMISMAALLIGAKNPYELSQSQLKQAKELLIKAKPNVKSFALTPADITRLFVSGEADVGYAATAGQVLRVARSGMKDVGFVVPKEGTVGFIDGNCIVKSSTNKANGLKWLNYYNSPEVNAKMSEAASLAPCNRIAVDLLEKSGKKEFVDLMRMRNMEQDIGAATLYQPPANIQDWINAWNEVKGA